MSNSKSRDDESGAAGPASPRTTIVGGQPQAGAAELPPIPTGIQRLLRLASVDEGFRRELIEKRARAADAAGVELRAAEVAILDAVPASQLERMVQHMPPPAPPRREFLRQTAATAVVLLGGAAFAESVTACRKPVPAGIRPDVPPQPPPQDTIQPPEPMVQAGQQPDVPPEPEPEPEPEPDPDAGVRPTELAPPTGIQPDMPPPREPHPPLPNAGQRPDIPGAGDKD